MVIIFKSVFYLLLIIYIFSCSISELSLDSSLHAINLHCNNISKIEAIDHVWNLQHLDLSSNQIDRIEGLNTLTKLCTLNLSCNLITRIEGLWFSCDILPKEDDLSPLSFFPKEWNKYYHKLLKTDLKIYYIKVFFQKSKQFFKYFAKYQ